MRNFTHKALRVSKVSPNETKARTIWIRKTKRRQWIGEDGNYYHPECGFCKENPSLSIEVDTVKRVVKEGT